MPPPASVPLPLRVTSLDHLLGRARTLGSLLREEFGVPFAFYDGSTGDLLLASDSPDNSPPTREAVLASATGGAEVRLNRSGKFQILLPFPLAGEPTLVASATLDPVSAPVQHPEGCPDAQARIEVERARLSRWANSVLGRLLVTDQQPVSRHAEEEANAALTAIQTIDRLMRSLRLYRQSPRNPERILQPAFELLGVEGLYWLPTAPGNGALTLGTGCLEPGDPRKLIEFLAPRQDPDPRGSEAGACPVILERAREPDASWAKHYPHVRNLLAFAVCDHGTVGWVAAVNRKAGPFRRSDVALLMPFATLLQTHLRTARRYHDLQDLLVGLTRSLTAALDAKDAYTFGHSERVARVAVELGRELGLEPDELSDLYLAGLLHDIGNIGVKDSILGKKTPLTPEEFEHIKRHVTIGYTILADLRQIRNLLPGVLYHHERYDGTGYPDGLAGDAIPLVARILSVADAYDALSTSRPYRPAVPGNRIEEVFRQGTGRQWDARVIEAFFRCRHRIYATRQRGVGESLRRALEDALAKGDPSQASSNEPWPALVPVQR